MASVNAGAAPTVGDKRRWELGLTDLPLHLLGDIALRVADSPLYVAPLPPPGPRCDDERHRFLGDHPVPPPSPFADGAGTAAASASAPSTAPDDGWGGASTVAANGPPSSVLTRDAAARLVPLLLACRRLHDAGVQAVTGVDASGAVDTLAAVGGLAALPAARTLLATDTLGCLDGCCDGGPSRGFADVLACDAAAAREEAFLLHEALPRCAVAAFGYRGEVLPRPLLRALASPDVVPLRRLVLHSPDWVLTGLAPVLAAHAGTLQELSLLLMLPLTFFGHLVDGRHGGALRFPALRALCLRQRCPADVARLVAACPALTAVRFMPWIPRLRAPPLLAPAPPAGWTARCGASAHHWAAAEGMLATALAPAVGSGSLTSLEVGTDVPTGVYWTEAPPLLVASSADVVAAAAAHQATLRHLLLTCAWGPDTWLGEAAARLRFPALRTLSLRLSDVPDVAVEPLLDYLAGVGSADRFPVLAELRLSLDGRGGVGAADAAPPPRAIRRAVAMASGRPWAVRLPALRRLHLSAPVEEGARRLAAVSSPSLTELSVAQAAGGGRAAPPPALLLPAAAVASLPARCPALRALRVEGVEVDPAFPATLALRGVRCRYVRCRLSRAARPDDLRRMRATQSF